MSTFLLYSVIITFLLGIAAILFGVIVRPDAWRGEAWPRTFWWEQAAYLGVVALSVSLSLELVQPSPVVAAVAVGLFLLCLAALAQTLVRGVRAFRHRERRQRWLAVLTLPLALISTILAVVLLDDLDLPR